MTKVKICGLKRTEDVDYVNRLVPDYVGFVFVPKSRRFVDFDYAEKLRNNLLQKIRVVGVFANAPEENIVESVERGLIDFVQLHGREDPAYLTRLRNRINVPIIQAFSISNSDDVEKLKNSRADFVLLDNGAGGTGKTFNWSLAPLIGRPFFLAGGLNSKNIAEGIRLMKPFAVDVSSGVETNGVKDFKKIQEIINIVRNRGAD